MCGVRCASLVVVVVHCAFFLWNLSCESALTHYCNETKFHAGESAGGAYPLNAVRVMGNICIEAESILDYDRTFQFLRTKVLAHGPVAVGEAVAASAVNTAVEIHAAMIVVLTETGRTASLIAKYRPSAPILVLTPSGLCMSREERCALCSSWLVQQPQAQAKITCETFCIFCIFY